MDLDLSLIVAMTGQPARITSTESTGSWVRQPNILLNWIMDIGNYEVRVGSHESVVHFHFHMPINCTYDKAIQFRDYMGLGRVEVMEYGFDEYWWCYSKSFADPNIWGDLREIVLRFEHDSKAPKWLELGDSPYLKKYLS